MGGPDPEYMAKLITAVRKMTDHQTGVRLVLHGVRDTAHTAHQSG